MKKNFIISLLILSLLGNIFLYLGYNNYISKRAVYNKFNAALFSFHEIDDELNYDNINQYIKVLTEALSYLSLIPDYYLRNELYDYLNHLSMISSKDKDDWNEKDIKTFQDICHNLSIIGDYIAEKYENQGGGSLDEDLDLYNTLKDEFIIID